MTMYRWAAALLVSAVTLATTLPTAVQAGAQGGLRAGWFHGRQPLVCPADGNSAGEPEFFYDRGSAAWHLLWRQNVGSCGTRIMLQRFDPATGTLTGTQRRLLSGDDPAMGFDEFSVAACPGGRSPPHRQPGHAASRRRKPVAVLRREHARLGELRNGLGPVR